MSDPFEKLAQLDSEDSYSWGETWIRAITKPTEDGYGAIAADPGGSQTQAYVWVFLCAIIGYIFTILITGIFGTDMFGTDFGGFFGVSMLVLLCFAPIGGVFAVLGVIISSGLTQWMAGALGGEGSYSKLVYVQGAYVAPISLISSLISVIPFVNCLTLPLGLYGIYLNILSIKVVNRFGWGKAIASSVMVLVLVLFFVGCLVAVVLALLGPVISDVFEEVMRSI